MNFLEKRNKSQIRLKFLFTDRVAGSWGNDPIKNKGTICIRAADIITDMISHKNTALTRRLYSQAEIDAKSLIDGDIIIERSGGGDNQPVGRIAIFDLDEPALCSNFLSVLRPDKSIVRPKFAAYLLYYLWKSKLVEQHIKQTTGIQNLNSHSYFSIHIPSPKLITQDQITNYLDRETAYIDKLINEKEKMLRLLKQKHEALISHTVTHGLNTDVTLKPSGLNWLGDIPEHWRIERAKNIFSIRDERSKDGLEELLSVSHITGVTSRTEKDVNMFMAENLKGYKKCRKDDFITNTLWAWMGAMGISPLDGIVSPDYHVYTSKGIILPAFMELLCRSKPFIAEVIRWSKGVWSSRLRLYPENFMEIIFPIPPLSEQTEIVAAIKDNQKQTVDFTNALLESISLLKERRAALITAAVTGQIEPEEMVA